MELEITLLGTGLPYPNPKRAGPSYLIRAGHTKAMVECGSGAVRRLVEAGHSPGDIHRTVPWVAPVDDDATVLVGDASRVDRVEGDATPDIDREGAGQLVHTDAGGP